MRQSFILQADAIEDIVLRTITEADCEDLRGWKNANRFAFFFQEVITSQQQKEWFKGYLAREKDYMFIILYLNQAVGSMGFRLLDSHADIYNVILGNTESARRGIMTKAMRIMCSYIYSSFTHKLGLKVLRSNSAALQWYRKNGFRLAKTQDTYFELELAEDQFQPCGFQKVDPLQTKFS